MAKEDRNGCLHSETNGRFIRKTDAEKRKELELRYNAGVIYDTIEAAKVHKKQDPVKKDAKFNLTFNPQSDGYKAKFQLITEDIALASELHSKACDLLSKCNGRNCEAIYLYDTKSKSGA